jgi:hypothetical protein
MSQCSALQSCVSVALLLAAAALFAFAVVGGLGWFVWPTPYVAIGPRDHSTDLRV